MTNQPIKFAVIGCGHIGKRHAEMIARHPEAKLAALVDIKEKKDLGLAQTDVPFFSSLKSFLESDVAAGVEVVSIATANGDQAQQGLEWHDTKERVNIARNMALTKQDAERAIVKVVPVPRQGFALMQNRHSRPSVWVSDV